MRAIIAVRSRKLTGAVCVRVCACVQKSRTGANRKVTTDAATVAFRDSTQHTAHCTQATPRRSLLSQCHRNSTQANQGSPACTVCMETVLCAAVGTASHQHGLAACTVYGDCTVCSCRHSKSSAWVSSMYCVWRLLCAAVGTARHQHRLQQFPKLSGKAESLE